jgi:hypothetical protein
MALHAEVDMELDDLVEIEFPTPHPVKVMATVRNRNGRYFGLEFLARLHGQADGLPKNRPPAIPKPHAKIADNVKITDPALVKKISAALDRKLLEITRVRREIEALIIAAPLLAEYMVRIPQTPTEELRYGLWFLCAGRSPSAT